MTLEGDYKADKDVELPLDGIGGVSIVVKADVHRSGKFCFWFSLFYTYLGTPIS